MFRPTTIGRLQLEHKVVLAPLTRMRAPKESEGVFVPGDLNVEYYSQRASKGGFMLTEACPISRLVSFFEVADLGGQRLTDFTGCWLSRCSWHLHAVPDRWLEAGDRCRTR